MSTDKIIQILHTPASGRTQEGVLGLSTSGVLYIMELAGSIPRWKPTVKSPEIEGEA